MKIDRVDLLAAMAMPPEEAVAFLQSKGLVVTNGWRELWKEAHRRAFTVAQSAGYDVLQDIKDALVDSLKSGKTIQQFIDELKPVLKSKGWWGKAIDPATGEIIKTYEGTSIPVQLGSPYRLKLIYEQNLQTALMAGRYRAMKDAAETHPGWQYVAVLDTRTRPAHRALHGRVFRHDDAAWSVAYPPCGWRCRCRVRPLSLATMQAEGLPMQSAKDYIVEVDVPQRNGTVAKVKRITMPGMQKPFQPDVGWDYKPAADFQRVK